MLLAPDSDFASFVEDQFQIYFSNSGHSFKIPLLSQGTDFQQRVRLALVQIPAGECRRYGELAADLGSSPRAVGNACRRNPTPLVVPCHRVVAASGIGGFMGQRSGGELDIKRWLLRHEKVSFG